MKSKNISMTTVYQHDADRILAAQSRSKSIHQSGDIDASGDEIEKVVREYLQRRLPSNYYVAHGHIVDRNQNVSRQFDVIIADSLSTPVLFEAENGTQYIPYESVYAIGEIKSTYYKNKHPIEAFGEAVKELSTTFEREDTPPNYIGNGIHLGIGLDCGVKEAPRNPLFTFAFFCNSGDMDPLDLAKQYGALSDKYSPQIAICLDGAVVVKSKLVNFGGRTSAGPIELSPLAIRSREDLQWILIRFLNETRQGEALATMMMGIFNHLNSCVLMKPPINTYLNNTLSAAAYQGVTIPI